MALPDFVEDLGDGVYAIDTGFHRPRHDAAWLLVDGGRAAFIDTGTHHTLPRHLATLDALGIARTSVDFVIPTHAHLDHAGGAGSLMRELPQAMLIAHPRAARHLIDPSAVWAGAAAVYGEDEMHASYGEVVPVPEARVRSTHDGMDLLLGTRRLHFIDTPGHARHHHCIWDERTRSWFAGDTFGISYREIDRPGLPTWILPTSSPSQFEPELLHASIDRMLSFAPARMCITHYGAVGQQGDAARLGALLHRLIDEMVAQGRALAEDPQRSARLREVLAGLYQRSLAEHGRPSTPALREQLTLDVELNAQGIELWLDREAMRTGRAARPS